MARARLIKPGFFTNDDLAKLPPLTRILFAGLWCIADREGRLEDRPDRIKAEVLPYDKCYPSKMLQDLHEAGFIERYASGGKAYIQVCSFAKHQSPHMREPGSTIPPAGRAPDEHRASTSLAPDEHQYGPAVIDPVAVSGDPVSGDPVSGDPVSGDPDPVAVRGADSAPTVAPAPAPRTRAPARKSLTPEQRLALVQEFSGEGLTHVNDRIDAALNHKAVDKCKDEALYVRAWLRRDLQPHPGNGHANAPPPGPHDDVPEKFRNNSILRAVWREKYAPKQEATS